ncbi:MAG TPA: hypothetical protein VL242_46620, partial [Sorangium sp.]|nr:hypothetical protein [Sorangium sp.]
MEWPFGVLDGIHLIKESTLSRRGVHCRHTMADWLFSGASRQSGAQGRAPRHAAALGRERRQ